MKIGIYGGTFNPPHLGHMAAARNVAEALELDQLILIPDRTPPHKKLPEGTATAEQRLEMTQIMADRLSGGSFKVCASDIELKRTGKSFSSDTLTELRELYPEDELWLFMGTDMFMTLHQWHCPEIICEKAGIAAFGRESGDTETFGAQQAFLEKEYNAKIQTFTLPDLVAVSSTQLRDALLQGGGQDLLDQGIYGYILRHRLYGVQRDWDNLSLDDLRAMSNSMVKKKRLAHIRGTEEESALLARTWGADEQDARRAAILHDCTKYWTLKEQLQYCEKYDIVLDQVERKTLALLHAKTGAGVAEHEFHLSAEICSAIRWHTTGKADMTLLEKILYIADYAEPSRSYGWCDKLRSLVLEDLDAGVLYGLNVTIDHNSQKNNPLHPKTLEARDWLIAQGVKEVKP